MKDNLKINRMFNPASPIIDSNGLFEFEFEDDFYGELFYDFWYDLTCSNRNNTIDSQIEYYKNHPEEKGITVDGEKVKLLSAADYIEYLEKSREFDLTDKDYFQFDMVKVFGYVNEIYLEELRKKKLETIVSSINNQK